MLVEVFFHFFGRGFSDNSNAVVVDFYALITLAVPVFGFGYHDFLYKLVYQFGCKLDASPSKEYRKAFQLISRNEETLQAALTDAQKELFARYLESQREFNVLSECLLFQHSFRLGARMMLAVMDKT